MPAGEEEHSAKFVPAPPPPPQPHAPVIVAFGLKPERMMGAEGRIDAVPEPPSAEQAGMLVDALRSGIQAGGAVIAIVPEWFPKEGLQRLEMARTIVDTARVAIHETALPPLAAAALASLASSLGPRLPSAGLAASALPGLEGQLHYITWLGSVTGLKNPTPTLGQHVASLTPGSAFGVSSAPDPAVHKIQNGQPSVPLPHLVRPSRLVIAPRNGDEQLDHRPGQRRARRAAGRARRRDSGRTGLLGHGQARRGRRLSGRSRRTDAGADADRRLVDLPLVWGVDRSFAVSDVRSSRASAETPASAGGA